MFRGFTHIFVWIYFDVASSFTALLLLKYSLQMTFQFFCLFNFFFHMMALILIIDCSSCVSELWLFQ